MALTETVEEILYETRNHASRPFTSNYPPQLQRTDPGTGSFLSRFTTRGRWSEYRHPKRLKKLVSLFTSRRGEYVAVAAGNQITILQKRDDYQEPCGVYICSSKVTFMNGSWSEAHNICGVVDDTDTIYFIKPNGEEITRITNKDLKVSFPIIGLIAQDESDLQGSYICTFNILTSDGSLHCIDVSHDPCASISSPAASNNGLTVKGQLPKDALCFDYNPEHAILVVIGSAVKNSQMSSGSSVEMPPSPALRGFPGSGELIVDTHKRRNSYEGGLIFKEKDEDLALFNEMRSREHDDFLLESADDFEDTFLTKLRYFSDYKLGISVPRRGENSDLLNADGEKNDYDWLLTPPDTPLFPSLDDETTLVNLTHRGRPRSQPISISRSSTMEKSYMSSRGSASPHRLSPSPQSRSSTIQSRGRPLSAPHSTSMSSVLHASPSRRPSPPSSKPSTPAARSSSPAPRRLSTGSSNTVSPSRARDNTTSVKTNRGNSASPKTNVWPSNIPGFSTDVPPNLRTSLADHPASYVRGSLPASRNNRDKLSRQSMSPTASRSIASSHGQDRDLFSSSKGSVASSGDDDVDSLQSVSVGSANRSTPKRVGGNTHSSIRILGSSKKPAGRIVSSSSAPKRSFDYAMRQMDRKTPQNMFRPLLSSVPSSTFYSGKASSAHRTMPSRNSSITTSSNTSSDQGTSMAIDPEFSDHNRDEAASDYGKTLHPDVHDEVFVFDKVDMPNEDNRRKHDESQNIFHDALDECPTFKSNQDESESFSHHGAEALQFENYFPIVDDLGEIMLCSACSCEYFATENVETDSKLCPDCRKESEIWTVTTPVSIRGVIETSLITSIQNFKDQLQSGNLNIMIGAPQFVEGADIIDPKVSKHEENVEQCQNDVQGNFVSRSVVEEDEQRCVNQQEMGEPAAGHTHKILDSGVGQQVHNFNDYSTSKVDVAEGAGISILLLNRSSSNKGPVVQGRNFTASMIPYGDLLYTRDSTNSIRSSIGQRSVSASSSVDLTSTRVTDTRVQRQSSGKKSETGSSCSTNSQHAYQVSVPAIISLEGNFEGSLSNVENGAVEEKRVGCQNQGPDSERTETNDTDTYCTINTILKEGLSESSETCRIMDTSTSEPSSHAASIQIEDIFMVSVASIENTVSYENHEDRETSVTIPESPLVEEHTTSCTSFDGFEAASVSITKSEIEIENAYQDSNGESDLVSPKLKTEGNDASDKKLLGSVSGLSISNYEDIMLDEMAVLARGQYGSKATSLDEAKDTILFCSSIVHSMAYQAATIAIQKEEDSVSFEPLRPTVSIPEKSKSTRKHHNLRSASKENMKSYKAKQKQDETDMEKPFQSKTESDIKTREPLMRNVGLPNKADHARPPKLESKCNCTIM